MKLLLSHKQLDVYKLAYKLAMEIFYLSKKFPADERYSLTDKINQEYEHVIGMLVNMINSPEKWSV